MAEPIANLVPITTHSGYCHGLSMFSPHYSSADKIFGPVYTVKMVDVKNKAAPQPDKHFADCIPKGSVVYVSQPRGLFSACWGGLMSTRAKILGAEGVVIDGNFRDLLEHRELGMPVSQQALFTPRCARRVFLTGYSCMLEVNLHSVRTASLAAPNSMSRLSTTFRSKNNH